MAIVRKRLSRFWIGATIALAGALAASAGLDGQASPEGQQPRPVFRADVNYVDVDVVVTDGRGAIVRNLTKDAFEVLEDGEPQQVDVFSFVDIPIPPISTAAFTPAATVERDVSSNVGQADGRIYLILLDDLQTDATRSPRVKASVRLFIERHFGPADLAAIVYTSGRSDAAQPFTSSPRRLLEAVDKFVGRKLRSATLERLDNIRTSNPATPDPDPRLARTTDPMEAERAYRARSTLDTLRRVSEFLAAAHGRRKALLYVSEGIDYDTQGVVAQTQSKLSFFTADSGSVVRNAIRDAIAAATRANVRIYAFDPRGLAGSGDELIEVGGRFPANPQTGVTPEAFQEEIRNARDTLRVLADETGGFAAINSNDLSGTFGRIVQDNSSYYVLGYHSSNKRRDGRFRSITVRLKRGGRFQIRARPGYVAPRDAAPAAGTAADSAPPALRDVVASPVPVSGLPLRVFAAPFRNSPAEASVLVGVEVNASSFRFEQRNGLLADDLDLSLLAFDSEGMVRKVDSHLVKLALTPETHRVVSRNGVRALFRLDLAPGQYQLRVAGHETGAALVGSVNYDIEVPDFGSEALSMSGIVLTSDRAAAVPTAKPDPQTSELPAPPSAERRLAVDDAMVFFIEVYDTARAPHLDVTATMTDSQGRVALRQDDRLALDPADRSGTYQIAAKLPTAGLAPGEYVLRIEARTEAGAQVARAVPVAVVPTPSDSR